MLTFEHRLKPSKGCLGRLGPGVCRGRRGHDRDRGRLGSPGRLGCLGCEGRRGCRGRCIGFLRFPQVSLGVPEVSLDVP